MPKGRRRRRKKITCLIPVRRVEGNRYGKGSVFVRSQEYNGRYVTTDPTATTNHHIIVQRLEEASVPRLLGLLLLTTLSVGVAELRNDGVPDRRG